MPRGGTTYVRAIRRRSLLMSTVDWGVGRYEDTALQLLPAARVVVDRAAPRPGERVVDVGCGTGNAALLAAERGARVTGVDPAARLLDVAREEAAARPGCRLRAGRGRRSPARRRRGRCRAVGIRPDLRAGSAGSRR